VAEKKVLGKGLEALIPATPTIRAREQLFDIGGAPREAVVRIPLESIRPNPYQPRVEINPHRLLELAQSVREKGVVQPIVVRHKGDHYELIAGERRWRAVKEAGQHDIPAIVRDVKEEDLLELALVENLQREDLNPIEEARAYQRLVDEFKLSQADIAEKVGRDRSTVSNTLRLLSLPEEIQRYISSGLISEGHARAILSLTGHELQIILARRILTEKLSVRDAEREVVNLQKVTKHGHQRRMALHRDPHILSLEEEMQRILGTKVRVYRRGAKGRIEIEFYGQEDFERILALLKVSVG
jgi:ParB family chromosome partitioning protein